MFTLVHCSFLFIVLNGYKTFALTFPVWSKVFVLPYTYHASTFSFKGQLTDNACVYYQLTLSQSSFIEIFKMQDINYIFVPNEQARGDVMRKKLTDVI